MNAYNPNEQVHEEDWLERDEDVRLSDIVIFHKESTETEPEGGWLLHSTLHCVVENQLALHTENVSETLAKLLRQGLPRHEAIHAIGAIVGEDLFEMSRDKIDWDSTKYSRRLEKLTAKRWRKREMVATYNMKFNSFAIAHSDVPTAGSFATGFAILSQTLPPQSRRLTWC